MKFSGKLLRGNVVVLPNLAGDVQDITRSSGIRRTIGRAALNPGEDVDLGEYELILDDGRSARIRVDDLSLGSHESAVLRFQVKDGFK